MDSSDQHDEIVLAKKVDDIEVLIAMTNFLKLFQSLSQSGEEVNLYTGPSEIGIKINTARIVSAEELCGGGWIITGDKRLKPHLSLIPTQKIINLNKQIGKK